LDFKEDVVECAAERVERLGGLGRSIFFAEARDIVKSLAATKKRFPDLIANVCMRTVAVREIEKWFDGLPEYVQIELWTRPSPCAYLAARTRLAFDAMLTVDRFPALTRLVQTRIGEIVRAAAMVQTDYPERWTVNRYAVTDRSSHTTRRRSTMAAARPIADGRGS